MTIYISKKFQAIEILKDENISINFNGCKHGAKHIGIVNLMPKKSETEAQIVKLLNNCDEDLNIHFIKINTYKSEHENYRYMQLNYEDFDEIKQKLDGIIITGAPLEKIEFRDVSYIDELNAILDYIRKNKKYSLYICWGAQVALNHFYGVRKELKESKIFGVFRHKIIKRDDILKDVYNSFKSPHSRYTSLNRQDIENSNSLELLAITEENEEHILKGNFNDYYILGHLEYDKDTLKKEYLRDLNKGLKINIPKYYFKNNSIESDIDFSWREDAIKIYSNWIKIISKDNGK
ncbi:Homoserine O-succinyltransferase [Sarcina ventriculi]|uniref:homoserine O-acetyltransferase/O-succinyltransferase family protein n=1 Tax=Sarcina ventriculi TaxID=1267 RepID=UPI000D888CDD|nr:homoserine O-succinyltransferase [Sarcina ventriculi]SPZ49993.1 Homoserine O-succinyltransferase [Sarcina ventriculi]